MVLEGITNNQPRKMTIMAKFLSFDISLVSGISR